MDYLNNVTQEKFTTEEAYNFCNDIYNLIADYHKECLQLIQAPKLTQGIINDHDHILNLLLGSCLTLLGHMKITEDDLHDAADKYVTHIGLHDSEHYMDRENLLERYKRIAIKELISFGLIPNPNYSKIYGDRTIYYGDVYVAWLKSEILDVVTGLTNLRKSFLGKNPDEKEYAFGLLVTLCIILETTNTAIDIPWSDI